MPNYIRRATAAASSLANIASTAPEKPSLTSGSPYVSSASSAGRERINSNGRFIDIALFSAYFPTHGGGIELVCADLVAELCRLGRRVNWVAYDEGPFPTHSNCNLTQLQGSDYIYRTTGVPFPIPSIRALRKIWLSVATGKVTLIAEANFLVSICAFLCAKFQRKPILIVQHVGAPSTISCVAAAVMKVAEILAVRPMLRRADRVVYISPVVESHFRRVRTLFPPQVIGHGIDTSCFRPASSKEERINLRREFNVETEGQVACYVGRLTSSKGIGIFMEVARLRPDWQFLVAGDGPVDPDEYGLPNVLSVGHLDRDTLAKLYRASDVLVLPSRSESFSLVVREALAAGLRVLCGKQTLQTDPTLARFVETCHADPAAQHRSGSEFARALDARPFADRLSARQYIAKHCSWTEIVSRYAEIIDEIELPNQGGKG